MGSLDNVQVSTLDEERRVIAAHQGHLVTGKFDIWAKRGVHVVWSERYEESFAHWLEKYANAWLNEVAHFFPSELGDIGWLLDELRKRLIGRIEYWKSEARRYLIEQAGDRNLCASSPTNPIATPEHGVQSASDGEIPDYELAEDRRSVRVRGVDHKVTPKQAKGLELLIEAYGKKKTRVPESKLHSALGNTPSNFFRSCPLWKMRYIRRENNRYFLVNPETVEVKGDSEKCR
jgi:hypothetical protein